MHCSSCSTDLPKGSSRCPTCSTPYDSSPTGSTSALASAELAIDLDGPANGSSGQTAADRPRATERVNTAPRFLPGDVLAARYRIVAAIGRGGMGEVYRADDLKLSQAVALKFLPAEMEADPVRRELLVNEVRLARQIVHPHVCRVYDVVEHEGPSFLTMEHIDGEHLGSLLRRIGRLPRAKALEIAHQVANGLAAAHAEGILHRDLKPANLMIDGRGQARITDFGLAVAAVSLDGRRARAGTPSYMAPEQLQGREVTARSDLYSLGLVLYKLFTGRAAFPDLDLRELLEGRRGRPAPPSRLVAGLDPAIERVLLTCLEEDPARRPESAQAVSAALPPVEEDAGRFEPEPGRALPQRPHWRLERRLGAGGFGEAWLAAHTKTGARRVFKLCRDSAARRALEREITIYRLLREALGDRDDISRIHDWSFDAPPYFIESEHCTGGNLAEWIESQGGITQVPLEVRLEIVAQVAEALAAAHSVGVLHKDVKPGNVLISDREQRPVRVWWAPQVRLSDFGVGHVTDAERLAEAGITARGLTQTGGGVSGGTPLYRAPELLEGKPATLQADIYALGVMLYQLVVGDLQRALGSGWERDIEDELLREDIAAAVDANPRRRLGNALRIAERLRELERRHAEAEAERRLAKENVRVAERRARRWRQLAWTTAIAVLALLAAVLIVQDERRARLAAAAAIEAAQARDAARLAVASEQLERDPSTAALVLLEIDNPSDAALAKLHDALRADLARLELRHGGWLWDVAWSPNGALLATASSDGTTRLWEAGSGELRDVFPGHTGPVLAIAWNPDSRRLATASSDTTVRLWDVAPRDGSPGPAALSGHSDRVWDLAWSPDGELLATASWDGTARVWAADGATQQLFAGHQDRVVSVAWSPEGRHLATASWDGTARIYDLYGVEPPRVLSAGPGLGGEALWSVAWSPDGANLVTASWDGTARVWALDATPEPLVLQGGGALWTARWSPGGDHILTASQDGTARVWPLARERGAIHASSSTIGQPSLLWHGGAVLDVAWSPTAELATTASRDGTARIWPLRTRDAQISGISSFEPRHLLGHDSEVRAVDWSPDGRRIATASRDGTARVWDAEPPSEPRLFLADQALVAVAWSPSGQRIAAATRDGTVRLWSLDDGTLEATATGHPGPLASLTWSPSGDRLLSVMADGTVRASAAKDGAVGERIGTLGEAVSSVAWSTGGAPRLLAVADSGAVQIWSSDGVMPRSAVRRLPSFDGPLALAAFGRGGRLSTVATDGTVRIWEADGASTVLLLGESRDLAEPPTPGAEMGVPEGFLGAAWNRTGDRLATFGRDRTVQVWRVPATPGEGVRRSMAPLELRGHQGAVTGVAWSPDGSLLASAGADATVRVWRLDFGALRGALRGRTRMCLDPARRTASLGESPGEASQRFADCERSQGRRP